MGEASRVLRRHVKLRLQLAHQQPLQPRIREGLEAET
jgi:hypothetical protein